MTAQQKRYALKRINEIAYTKRNTLAYNGPQQPREQEVLDGIVSGKYKYEFIPAASRSYFGGSLGVKLTPDPLCEYRKARDAHAHTIEKRVAAVTQAAAALCDRIMLSEDGNELLEAIASFAKEEF